MHVVVDEFLLQLRFNNIIEYPIELRDTPHDHIVDEHTSRDVLLTDGDHVGNLVENVDDDAHVTQCHRLDVWCKMPQIKSDEPDIVERLFDSLMVRNVEQK